MTFGVNYYGLLSADESALQERVQVFVDSGAQPSDQIYILKEKNRTRTQIAVLYQERWIVLVYNQSKQKIVAYLDPVVLTARDAAAQMTGEEEKEAWLKGEL